MKTICLKCGKEFFQDDKRKYKIKYCSRACSNSRTWSIIHKNKLSLISKTSEKVLLANRLRELKPIIKNCVCGGEFLVSCKNKYKKYCSNECKKQFRIKTKGGYREGSGRSKSGYYKGIYSGSTYELCWIIYNIDNNQSFTRFPGFLSDGKLKYYPDFLLSDNKTIVEIKGYEEREKVEAKIQLAKKFGYEIMVLYKKDLNEIFNHVEKTYKTKKFFTLYDNYKPKFDYICTNCSLSFKNERKIKTNETFCSRSCSGGYRAKIRWSHSLNG